MTVIRGVEVLSSALPTGAATSAAQTTGNASLASIDGKLPALSGGAVPVTGTVAVTGAGDASAANQTTLNTLTGAVNESAPGTDTASSGLNGRLQRIAQRVTSLITAIGSPFQAGGSIGNTAFGVNNGAGASAVNIQDGGNSITVDGTVGVSGSVAVTGTFWQATQPVSATSLPLPTGAATSATQTDRTQKTQVTNGTNDVTVKAFNVQVAGTDNGLATNSVLHGLTTGGGGGYVDVKVSPAGALTVEATQSGTWTLGANSGVDIGDVTINNAAGASAVNIQDGGNSITVDGTVGVSGSVAVTGTFWQATQPVSIASMPSTPVTGTFWQATQPVSGTVTANATLAAETTKVIGTVNVSAGQTIGVTGTFYQATQPVSIASMPSTPVTGTFWQATQPVSGTVTANATLAAETTKVIGTVNPPALTIGTNNANGFTVQPARDAGRTAVRYYAVAAAAGTTTTETAITLTRSSANAATTTGTSFILTSGKRFRIEAIMFATRGHATATAQTTTFNFRVNTAGAVGTTSTPLELSVRSATPATASAWDRVIVPIPDGWEILGDGTIQFGVTAAATYTTNAPTWDVTIVGFEY